jgi:hypothetical protein
LSLLQVGRFFVLLYRGFQYAEDIYLITFNNDLNTVDELPVIIFFVPPNSIHLIYLFSLTTDQPDTSKTALTLSDCRLSDCRLTKTVLEIDRQILVAKKSNINIFQFECPAKVTAVPHVCRLGLWLPA